MRGVRIALTAGVVAGLVVLAACTDNGDNNLTAPKTPTAPRLATASSGTFANAKHVDLCVSASSPPGNYTFVNSAEVNDNPKNAALQGNGFRFAGVWKDGGDGGTGTTVYNDNGGAPPNVAKGAGYTVTAGGTCVRVLDRTNANVNYDPNSLNEADRSDSYAGITVTNTATPGGAVYDHTDCLLDVGVLIPQRTISPLPAAYDPLASYNVGDLVSTNTGNRIWRAKTANAPNPLEPTEGANWTNAAVSGDCGSGNNPTRAFANFEHGTVLTFFFTGPLSSCPDGSLTAGFNGTAIPAGRTVWFVANLKPDGPIVDNTTISFQTSSINLAGTIIPGPSGTVTYSAAATDATTAFLAGVWQTIVPLSYDKDVFLAGTQYTTLVDLPGGVKPVTWTGAFSSNTAGVTAKWQFAAAVYDPFGAYAALGVKPIGGKTSLYPNGDKQGTPENFKLNLKSGAMGGGGSNFIGSWSNTKAACVAN